MKGEKNAGKSEINAPKKPKKGILAFLARLSRGYDIKFVKTTKTEWIFRGSDDKTLL